MLSSAWLYEHPRLKSVIARLPSRHVETPPSAAPPLLLLGIISVSAERRSLIRCTWAQLFSSLPARYLFVVGRRASDGAHNDLIVTSIEEHLLPASSNRPKTRRASGATYSSLSSFFKTHAFIKYAASAPERFIAFGDDDVFIQPQMLLAQ